jgi:hypothetical protein
VLFKIHGSDAPSPPYDDIVLTHDQESELPYWKTHVLHQLVDNRVLLVAGYSGLDLDILPALGKCKWIHIRSVRPLEGLGRKSPHGFDQPPFRIDDEKETLGIDADLQGDAFQRLSHNELGLAFRSIPGSRVDPARCIYSALQSLSPYQRSLWFALMIIHSGDWALGNRALDFVGGSDTGVKIHARADAFFYAGKYRACASQLQVLLKDQTANLTLAQRIDACCTIAGAFNCAGDSFTAWFTLLTAMGLLLRMAMVCGWSTSIGSLREILAQVVFSIPFVSYIPFHDRVEGIISELITKMGSYERATVLTRYSRPSKGALALGQRAALINEYRYAGRAAVDKLEAGDSSAQRDAVKWLSRSLIWANQLEDFPGLSKASLELWRLYMLAGDPVNALKFWKGGWQYAREVDYIGWRRFLTRSFAAAAERAGGVVPESITWKGTLNGTSLMLGKVAIALLSVR